MAALGLGGSDEAPRVVAAIAVGLVFSTTLFTGSGTASGNRLFGR